MENYLTGGAYAMKTIAGKRNRLRKMDIKEGKKKLFDRMLRRCDDTI